jgi:RNA polymerase sigma-70 factor (ECF subfamily)
MPDESEGEFAELLAKERLRLWSFILALVGSRALADDLCQSTCLELWRIRETFRQGTNFGAWSRTVAKYQVLRHGRKAARERTLFVSDAMEKIAEAYEAPQPDGEGERTEKDLRKALESCLEDLEQGERALLQRRYADGASIKTLSAEMSSTEGGLKMKLLRLRQRLAACIRSKTATEAGHHG